MSWIQKCLKVNIGCARNYAVYLSEERLEFVFLSEIFLKSG